MASSSRVTPRAVVSPVSTGWLQLVWTKDWAARLYTSDGRWSRNTATRDPSSSRSPATRVNRSWMWAIRSKLTVLDRRTTPTTSYPCSSRNSARYDPSCPVTPVINARFGMEPHGTSRAPGSTPTVPGGEHLNSVVPARRHRRGVGGGCQVAVGPGAVGAPGDDGGRGPVDHLLPGLAIDAPAPPEPAEVTGAVADADVVVVENLCSLPLNPAAA